MIKRDSYKSSFESAKPIVLNRDGNRCVKCGCSLSLEIHHVEGYKQNDPALLVTLCYLCHGVAPMGTERFKEWLANGESGVQTLNRYLAAKGLHGLGERHILAFCSALIDLGWDLNVNRFRVARERMRKSGVRCEGRKPFGLWEGEADALRQMLELRAEGKTCEVIADTLNERAVPTRGGGKWLRTVVAKILKREKVGRYRSNGEGEQNEHGRERNGY